MSHRTDPMFYDLEVEEIETGKVQRSQVGAWWSRSHSIQGLDAMCDCQLAGYFYAHPRKVRESDGREITSWANAFSVAQQDYLKDHGCNHGAAKKFRPARAILPSGEVIDLSKNLAA
jgi:hypothetical protein